MKIGRLGAEACFMYDARQLGRVGAECIRLRNSKQMDTVDGLLLCAEFSEQLCLSTAWCKKILQAAKRDLPIWGCGYGAYLLSKGKALSMLDCSARLLPPKASVVLLSVPLWEERFAVCYSHHVHMEQPAPNLAILATAGKAPMILRQGNVLACPFLPCQAKHSGIYRYFADMVADNRQG